MGVRTVALRARSTVTLGRYRRYRREAIEAWVEEFEAPARGARAHER
jgi:hypothetical protein